MAIVGGRSFKVSKGQSLVFQFSVYKQDATGIHRLFFDDRDSAPASGWTAINIDDYTVTQSVKFEDLAATFGAVSVVSGTPDKIKFALTDADSAALTSYGTYYGLISGANTSDTDETIDFLSYVVDFRSEGDVDRIPMSEGNILKILDLPTTFEPQTLKRIVIRTNNMMFQLLPRQVVTWASDNGWDERVITEAEQLGSLLLRKQIFDSDTTVDAEIKEQKNMIENLRIDLDDDGVLDTGIGSSIELTRTR